MAHTITAVDLGSYSLKFVTIEVGFRQSRIADRFETPVPPGEAPVFDRQLEALQASASRLPSEHTYYVAVPGEMLAMRVLDLPFADPRKIEQVMAFELEGQIVAGLDEVVYDHALVRSTAEGSAVLATAARIEELGTWLAALQAQNVDPRALFAAPIIYQTLFKEAPALEGNAPSCRLLIDIGHQRTNVCLLAQGKTIFARTIMRGGQTVTAAVARAYACDETRAEQIKHDHGFLGSKKLPVTGGPAEELDTVLRESLGPLLRELRQTLATLRSPGWPPLEGILLTGGGSRLGGLSDFLAEALEVPVTLWSPSAAATVADEPSPVEGDDAPFAVANAVAWAAAQGDRQIDLRRGPFVYKASFSVLRQKAPHLAVLGAALLVSVTLDATMNMARLGSQREKLEGELKAATQELFGTPRTDGREVAMLLKKGFKDEMAPLPKATAFDLLDQISRKMPPADIKLDVQDFDVRPRKVTMRGTVSSAAAVDDIQKNLSTIECFEEVKKGNIREVNGGKEFSLTIASKCP